MATLTVTFKLYDDTTDAGTTTVTIPRYSKESAAVTIDRARRALPATLGDKDDEAIVRTDSGDDVTAQLGVWETVQERVLGDFESETELYLRAELGEFAQFLRAITDSDDSGGSANAPTGT